MDYGVHLPLIGFDGGIFSLEDLQTYAATAERLGFQALTANDHLVFSRSWLDGPMALAAVVAQTGRMALGTSVSLPIIRGPVALAKTMTAIDLLFGRA
jgi:alkanesulfonate monooxygenase SsuD/methylene tetrahydromethanopterin reductase-like flavin-dependent oxidoreductase (luciferase family)